MFCKMKIGVLKTKKPRLEILTQPNLPKPLHGLNPRTILGKEWWDKTRFKAQSNSNYKCICCGVSKENAKEHQWLEGHESWDIDYNTGICEVIEILPLCHYCHNFIHNGRLLSMIKCSESQNKAFKVMDHGFKLLEGKNLKVFPGAALVAQKLGVSTRGVGYYKLPDTELKWSSYKMLLEGKLYSSLYKNFDEWRNYYER